MFSIIAITNYHRFSGLNNTLLVSHSFQKSSELKLGLGLETPKTEIKGSTGLCSFLEGLGKKMLPG